MACKTGGADAQGVRGEDGGRGAEAAIGGRVLLWMKDEGYVGQRIGEPRRPLPEEAGKSREKEALAEGCVR